MADLRVEAAEGGVSKVEGTLIEKRFADITTVHYGHNLITAIWIMHGLIADAECHLGRCSGVHGFYRE